MIARLLIAGGVLAVIVGVLMLAGVPIPLGRLPGDIRIETEHVRFYFPLATSILISIFLSGLVWLLSKL